MSAAAAVAAPELPASPAAAAARENAALLAKLTATVYRVVLSELRRSPFPVKAWPLVVVVVRAEGRKVLLRSDFAAWLRSNDLEGPALECMRRKVRPGEVLVWAEIDTPGFANAGFGVLPVGALERRSPSLAPRRAEI